MGVDPSRYPPPPRPDIRDDPGTTAPAADRGFVWLMVSVLAIGVLGGTAGYVDAVQKSKERIARFHAQSARETEACLEAGGLPHHDYHTGLLERCDR
jgi:hypothetical protein